MPEVPEGDDEVLAASDMDSVSNRAQVMEGLVDKQP